MCFDGSFISNFLVRKGNWERKITNWKKKKGRWVKLGCCVGRELTLFFSVAILMMVKFKAAAAAFTCAHLPISWPPPFVYVGHIYASKMDLLDSTSPQSTRKCNTALADVPSNLSAQQDRRGNKT